jgi:hypothetical protein
MAWNTFSNKRGSMTVKLKERNRRQPAPSLDNSQSLFRFGLCALSSLSSPLNATRVVENLKAGALDCRQGEPHAFPILKQSEL